MVIIPFKTIAMWLKSFFIIRLENRTDNAVVVLNHHGAVVKVGRGPSEQNEIEQLSCALAHRIDQRIFALVLQVLSHSGKQQRIKIVKWTCKQTKCYKGYNFYFLLTHDSDSMFIILCTRLQLSQPRP